MQIETPRMLTMKEAARETGLSYNAEAFARKKLPRGSIYKWGKNEPGVIKVQKVANYFKVTMEDLLKEKECE